MTCFAKSLGACITRCVPTIWWAGTVGKNFWYLNRCDPASAVARAENLRAGIAGKLISTPSKAIRVTISVGLALSVDFPQADVDEMIQQADLALYAAKRAGRNCVRLAPLASDPEARNGIAAESTALST